MNRLVVNAILCLVIATGGCANNQRDGANGNPNRGPDMYPGDTAFTRILLRLRRSVDNDDMDFSWGALRDQSKDSLCQLLVNRHKARLGQEQSNDEWLGCVPRLTKECCVDALTNPRGYDSPDDWNVWRGKHKGDFFTANQTIKDDAEWSPSQKAPTKVTGDNDSQGNPREYDHQPVEWPGRHGWNQSHPEIENVWGWDPKDNGNQKGEIGAHLGFTFTKGNCKYIIWITPKEAFLEGIRKDREMTKTIPRPNGGSESVTGYPRTATGLTGVGRWVVDR